MKNVFEKINFPKAVISLVVFAIVLNILRIVIWDKYSFVYILWNIFLAFIPFIISSLILSLSKEKKLNKAIFVIGGILWILFIPNAPYIVTDFVHIGVVRGVPVIYDVILLFSSATLGLILGFSSLLHIEEIIKLRFSHKTTFIIMNIIIFMISFGVYLGRFLRFNSWDVFINHTPLIKNVWKIFSQPLDNLEVYLYTILFFCFMSILYKSWKHLNIK